MFRLKYLKTPFSNSLVGLSRVKGNHKNQDENNAKESCFHIFFNFFRSVDEMNDECIHYRGVAGRRRWRGGGPGVPVVPL